MWSIRGQWVEIFQRWVNRIGVYCLLQSEFWLCNMWGCPSNGSSWLKKISPLFLCYKFTRNFSTDWLLRLAKVHSRLQIIFYIWIRTIDTQRYWKTKSIKPKVIREIWAWMCHMLLRWWIFTTLWMELS